MTRARFVLAALLVAAVLAPARPAAAAGLDIRIDDKVYLKDSPEPLVGEIVYQTKQELKIKLKSGISRIEPMANVRRVIRSQTASQAFEARYREYETGKNAPEMHRLALDALETDPNALRDNAIKALEAARTYNPDSGKARLLLGRLYLSKNWYERAAVEAEQVAKLMPREAAGFVLLGSARARQGGKAPEALAAVEHALTLNPSESDQVMAARALADIDRIKRALEIIEKVLGRSPNNAEAALTGGLIFLRQGDLVKAESLLTSKAVGRLKNKSELHLALAALNYLKLDWDAAAREAVQAGVGPRAKAIKGLAEYRRGSTDRADAALDDAMRQAPSIDRVAAAKAFFELARDDLDAALAALEHPAGKPGGCTDAYVFYLQGHIYYRKGDYQKSLTACGEALRLMPEEDRAAWIDGYLAAGAAALAAHNFPAAARYYGGAVKINDDLALAHAGLGLAYLGQVGRDEEADRELRRALTLDPKCVHAHMGLGYLANRRADELSAIKYFSRAFALDASSRYTAEALEKLRSGRGEEVEIFTFDGPGLPTGWKPEQLAGGVQISSADGRVVFSGKQKRVNDTRFYLNVDSRTFSRMEMEVETAPTGALVAGVFLAGRRGFIELGMFETGKIAWRFKNRSQTGLKLTEVADWPVGADGAAGKVRLAIEMVDADRGQFRLYSGGSPAATITVDTLAGETGFQAGAFARAELDGDVLVGLDNATLISKKGDGQ